MEKLLSALNGTASSMGARLSENNPQLKIARSFSDFPESAEDRRHAFPNHSGNPPHQFSGPFI
jgi:hypothetical protein